MLPLSMLRYLGRSVGEAEAEAVRIAAGELRTMPELMERGTWSELGTTLAIAAEAARLTGDAQIGRRGGEELFRIVDEIGRTDLLRTMGGLHEALAFVVAASSQVSIGRAMSLVRRGETGVTVSTAYSDGSVAVPLLCDFGAGYWSSVPSVFGASGYAIHVSCEARGDDRCRTEVSWVAPAGPAMDTTSSSARADEMFFRYEELQRMAADVATATDVPAVLDLVVRRAGHAVLAPRFLLIADLGDGVGTRVHHLGFDDDASARAAAEAVTSGAVDASTLVVDVASTRGRYGSLAALYTSGARGTDLDRRLMTAYAAHVAAALESTVAFSEARRDRDTARAFLDLSRRLAGATSVAGVAQRLAGAVRAIAEGARASVELVDPLTGDLCPEASDPGHDVDDRTVHHVVSRAIVARGELLGQVSASFDHDLPAGETALLAARLAGFADQAATALDNARLIERVHHQATHDVLTGLPNRPLLEDRAGQAFARAARERGQVGLLFLDLDRFKHVNDTFGHRAGDDLICQAARRLSRELRAVDTLARLGGDEFVALLPDVDGTQGAVSVAERLVRAFAPPFTVAGQQIHISVSIGLAVSPDAGTDYESLIQHADAAMYRAKALGANTFAA